MPAQLALLLTRQALSQYALACEDAQFAAERCAAANDPTPDELAQLCEHRMRVMTAEATLGLLPYDVGTREVWDVSLDATQHDLIVALVGSSLNQVCGELESPEKKILAAAETIGGLRALLGRVEAGAR